jgi:DinB superfamily
MPERADLHVAWLISENRSGLLMQRPRLSAMTTPDAIVPDDKDWTWVLSKPCPECGFDSAATNATDVADMICANAKAWQTVLMRSDVRVRPKPDTWSPLEYACHVRDVFDLYDMRLHLMLDQDAPTFPNWNQDITAVEQRYSTQDPAVVAAEVDAAAERLAASFSNVKVNQWQRSGLRSDGALFTIDSFARYLIHDPVHHLRDVGA